MEYHNSNQNKGKEMKCTLKWNKNWFKVITERMMQIRNWRSKLCKEYTSHKCETKLMVLRKRVMSWFPVYILIELSWISLPLFYLINPVFSNQKDMDEETCNVYVLLHIEIETCNDINSNSRWTLPKRIHVNLPL